MKSVADQIKIGIIGDYDANRPAHIATNEALNHCAKHMGIDIRLQWLGTESLEIDVEKINNGFDGFWCSPGEYKSPDGAINAIRFARENNFPFIGTCGGFQYTVIEYVRNKLGLADVQHEEYSPNAKSLLISLLSCSLV